MADEIRQIDVDTILIIWKDKLWPNRISPVESHSAMMITPGQYDIGNFLLPAWYYGYYVDNILVGVNSGHLCTDGLLRIRGFWVHEDYRKRGIGKQLLVRTINDAKINSISGIWAYPRRTSWPIFESLGFLQTSNWESSEMSEANTYCLLDISA